jgi:hypothetical protein
MADNIDINVTPITRSVTIEVSNGATVSDVVYGVAWNGETTVAPSKNALYDFIETQVFKVDTTSNIIPIFWGGTQSEYDIDFPSGHPSNYFIVITDGAVTPLDAADITISDTGGLITATNVEDALQENRTAINLNTAKVTNATHTGDVTGTTALTIESTAISGKSANAGLVGTEEVLINNAGTLEKTTTQDIADLGNQEVIQIACSDLITDITTGTSKAYFRMPYAATLNEVRVSLLDAGTVTGLTVDINENGVSVLSTLLTTDATEKTSTTATTAAVISDSALADDSEITIDFDAVPTAAKGVIVTLKLTRL